MSALEYTRVVLVEPSHPGNIGACARAMANMGVNNLVMVSPRTFPSPEAVTMAAGADWILDQATCVSSLAEAVADCTMVIGTTARLREIQWPQLAVRDAMTKAAQASAEQQVAIVFGRERSGLSNAEMDMCHYLVQVSLSSMHSSLNLAQAVLLMLYELRTASLEQPPIAESTEPLASHQEVEGFYAHLFNVLDAIEFRKSSSSEKLDRKIRRLFNRSKLQNQEVNILRGILSEFQRVLSNKK